MTKRKQTPDVLAAILGGDALAPEFSAGGNPARTIAKEEAAEPRLWEYQIISFQDYKGWRPRFVDGRELRDWTNGPFIHEVLEQKSQEGWELAAATSGEHLYGNADLHQLYLKRLKALPPQLFRS